MKSGKSPVTCKSSFRSNGYIAETTTFYTFRLALLSLSGLVRSERFNKYDVSVRLKLPLALC